MSISKSLILATTAAATMLILSGCSTTSMKGAENSVAHAFSSSEVVKTTKANYKPTDPKTVALYYDNKKPSHKYKTIGRVNANAHNFMAIPISEQNIRKAMKTRAASIGGNAVINIHRNLDTETGNVVRYVN